MTQFARSLAASVFLALPVAASAQDVPVLAVISHPVEDYGVWRQVYDAFADEQQAGGVIMEQVFQDPGLPNNVLVLHGFESLEAAEAFLTSDKLKSAMEGAGVAAAPTVKVVARAD
ncbi:hypothetical protein [Marinovum sp.]|uniref:hypothetical protein n=1 Tax=Marinovum sp. TaxID=2024839 RepID=UPI002B277B7A|nr:hypothetical protein [Marinovum sp.]